MGAELPENPPDKGLRAYALAQLAQREYSRTELRRKLFARLRASVDKLGRQPGESPAAFAAAQLDCDPGAAVMQRVETVLDWLEAHRYLSEQRFIESRLRVRSERFGNLRIRQELAQHGLALPASAEATLAESEFERAQAIWERKFNSGSGTTADAAKQARFLEGRGFSGDVIRRVLRNKRGAASTCDAVSSADLISDKAQREGAERRARRKRLSSRRTPGSTG